VALPPLPLSALTPQDRHLKDERYEGEESISPFAHLDKSAVLQDCRVFHDANFVRMHPKRCCQQITRLLWFLVQGETFSGPDAEAVFFGVTKLFQSTDGNLRRMVYLFLKAVAESTDASSLIIVTQSLVRAGEGRACGAAVPPRCVRTTSPVSRTRH
jgi:coatomer subunit gamma